MWSTQASTLQQTLTQRHKVSYCCGTPRMPLVCHYRMVSVWLWSVRTRFRRVVFFLTTTEIKFVMTQATGQAVISAACQHSVACLHDTSEQLHVILQAPCHRMTKADVLSHRFAG